MRRALDLIDLAIARINLRDPKHHCAHHCAPTCPEVVQAFARTTATR